MSSRPSVHELINPNGLPPLPQGPNAGRPRPTQVRGEWFREFLPAFAVKFSHV
jgi:hypothetical protein